MHFIISTMAAFHDADLVSGLFLHWKGFVTQLMDVVNVALCHLCLSCSYNSKYLQHDRFIIPYLRVFKVAQAKEFNSVEIRITVCNSYPSCPTSKTCGLSSLSLTEPQISGCRRCLWVESTSSGLVQKQTDRTEICLCAFVMRANIILSLNSDLSAGLACLGNYRRSHAGQTEHSPWRGSRDERKHFVHGNQHK